jgi:hypothetical protein
MATLAQLETALRNAHAAGDADAARRLAVVVKAERDRLGGAVNIPGYDQYEVPGTTPKKSESLAKNVAGVGEAALSVATSVPAAVAGNVAGIGKGLFDIVTGKEAAPGTDPAAELAGRVIESTTYQPRTETGGKILETVGTVAEPLMALGPMTAELGAIGKSVAAAKPVAGAAVAEGASTVRQATTSLINRALEKTTQAAKPATPVAESPKPYVPINSSEVALIREYQNGASINNYLRDAQNKGPHEFVAAQAKHRLEDPNVKAQLEALDSSIAKNTTPEDVVLYRGANKVLANLPEDGAIFTDPAFVAASTDANVGAAFGDLIRIKVPKGTPILDVNKALGEASRYPNQKEMILPRNLKFRAGTDPDGVRTLEVINDAPPTSAPPRSTTGTATGTGRNAGAAGTDLAAMRRANAEELGFTGDSALTRGQATRDFELQRFERETAKMGDIGEPIRQRMQNQNLRLQQALDEFIDSTGAELTELRDIGGLVDKSLRQRAARDKVKVRALYKEAEKAGEMQSRVQMDSVMEMLNNAASAEGTAPIISATRKELERLGALNYFGRGEGIRLTLADAENLRKFVNKNAGSDKTNVTYAREIKAAIDAATEGKGGEKYKAARAAHAQMMADYENFGLAKQLLKTKRGSADRAVALEDVLRQSVLSPTASVDSVMKLKQLLTTEGPLGFQAWRELQGGMLRHIRDEALKGVTRDSAGNQVVSAAALDRAITALDKTGKLEAVLGKRQADKVRLVNDVAKDIFTSPPGAVNTSNTATVLAGLLDVAISGTAGIPAPVATVFNQVTSRIKDARLRARVKEALGE